MKKYLSYLIVFASLLVSCDNYLDVVPEKDILTIEAIFQQRATAHNFFPGCYRYYELSGGIYSDPAMSGGDEFLTDDFFRNRSYSGIFCIPFFKIGEGLQNPSSPISPLVSRAGVNLYKSIRDCNTFITHIDDVYNMRQEEKDKYKASAKAAKAYHYFELMKRYGPIVLVPKNISVEASMEEMQTPRSPIDSVVKAIVRLYDEAIPDLDYSREQIAPEYGYITREAAYVYKAKALLYAASPLFNGNEWYTNFKNRDGLNLFNANYDENKWKVALDAIEEAIDLCESQDKKLEDSYKAGNNDFENAVVNVQASTTPHLFKSDELIHGTHSMDQLDIMMRLPKIRGAEFDVGRPMGCLNPTMRMVELFYTENGLPIDMDKDWDYAGRYQAGIELSSKYKSVVALNKSVLKLHLKREPRFYATVGFDRGFWGMKSNKSELNPYFMGRNGEESLIPKLDEARNLTGYWCKKFITESMTADGSQGGISTGDVPPYCKLRMAELYLMKAEAMNEVYGPCQEVYDVLDKIRERAGIPKIQKAWEKHAKNPGKIKTKEGLRDVIRQEINIEFAFEGHRFWDLRRWKLAHLEMVKPIRGWNIYGETSDRFYNGYKGPIVVWNRNRFTAPRDYFWPYKDEEVLKANIVQNLGW